jgi:RNA polymerase sigma factor (sigma-70 family)
MSTDSGHKKLVDFLRDERNRLVGYVRNLIDDASDRDGEDIVQDVILSVYARGEMASPIEDLSAYVYQSLRNRVVDYFRKRREGREIIPFDGTDDDDPNLSLSNILYDPKYDAFDELYRAEIRERIFEAIDSLGDDEKAVIIETEFNGRTYREMSQEWDVPVGTLLSRKSRALEKIREALSDLNK